jgi:hypothetical protein
MTPSSGGIRRDFPLRHGVEAVKVGSAGRAAGAGWNEKVADGREHDDEPLQPSGRSKALPRPFASAKWQMRILRPIIKPLVRAVFDVWHDLTPGGRVGAELVVIIRQDGQPCFFKRRLSRRFAAVVLRRVWRTSSST